MPLEQGTAPPPKLPKKWNLVHTVMSISSKLNGASINKGKLATIVQNQDLVELQRYGGVRAIAKFLKTDTEVGIKGGEDDLSNRRMTFGSNASDQPNRKGLTGSLVVAFTSTLNVFLLIYAIVCLVFAVIEYGIKDCWNQGGGVLIAVLLRVIGSALVSFIQERKFMVELSKRIKGKMILVRRCGELQKVPSCDVVVGDVVVLRSGDEVPADGLFIAGYMLKVDESRIAGKGDHVAVNSTHNPYLFSGSNVLYGDATMLVTSVKRGAEAPMATEQSPLQERAGKLTSVMGKVGIPVSILVFVGMLYHYILDIKDKHHNWNVLDIVSMINYLLKILTTTGSTLLVVVPKGIGSAINIMYGHVKRRMRADQVMVQKLWACDTMGSATVICTNMIGTLTLNRMEVTKFWIGSNEMTHNDNDCISEILLGLLYEGVMFNTTRTSYDHHSPTDDAILSWAARKLDFQNIKNLKQNYYRLDVKTFSSHRKQSGVLIRSQTDNSNRAHWKGAAEMVLAMCTTYYEATGELKSLNGRERSQFLDIIQGMASSSLHCIAFAYKETEPGDESSLLNEVDLTLLGIIGMKDPCRPGAKEAIESCRAAGVDIKLVTGDHLFTAKAIATKCGILEDNQHVLVGEVIQGIEFRGYSQQERLEKIDKIRIVARATPEDKQLMVRCLKQKHHVVAVIGDGCCDSILAPKEEADVVLSLGDAVGGEQNSDILMLHQDLIPVTKVVQWGRCTLSYLQKFLQIQLTLNVALAVNSLINAFSAHNQDELTIFQLFWMNFATVQLGQWALAKMKLTQEVMHNPPVPHTEPLVTNIMLRNILPQAIYQIAVHIAIQLSGMSILGGVDDKVRNTLDFNTTVLCQIFNLFNSRHMEEKNVFRGIHKSRSFLIPVGITIILQFVVVQFLGKVANTKKLNLVQWGISFAIALITLPICWIVKFIPVPGKPFVNCFSCVQALPTPSENMVSVAECLDAVLPVEVDIHKIDDQDQESNRPNGDNSGTVST